MVTNEFKHQSNETNIMNLKRLTLLVPIILSLAKGPAALHAMEDSSQDSEQPPSLSEIKALVNELQELRLLNERRNLPALHCSVKLFDPSKIVGRTQKYLHSNRDYIAESDKEGKYILDSNDSSTSRLHYHPIITSLRIDPENRTAALITYRFTKDSDEESAPHESDIALSITYATPRIFNVEIHDENETVLPAESGTVARNNETASQKLVLAILIEKTTSPSFKEEMEGTRLIHEKETAQQFRNKK